MPPGKEIDPGSRTAIGKIQNATLSILPPSGVTCILFKLTIKLVISGGACQAPSLRGAAVEARGGRMIQYRARQPDKLYCMIVIM